MALSESVAEAAWVPECGQINPVRVDEDGGESTERCDADDEVSAWRQASTHVWDGRGRGQEHAKAHAGCNGSRRVDPLLAHVHGGSRQAHPLIAWGSG